tara:strand:+ start:280 stop:771 length:492 start_codon:yes stop_codon:yes gene_type:complete
MGIEVAIGMMIVGTAVSAYGQYQSGKAQKAAYDYNAQIEERNAQIARDQAAYDAKQQEKKTRQIIASQRVAYAAGGFTTAGTPLDTLRQSATEGEMDRMAILYGGDVEAQNRKSQAELQRMQGRAAKTAGTYAAVGTAIGGFGNAAGVNAQANMVKPGSGLWS